MARHLHEQSGGNPSDHGPVPELANRRGRSDDDFPDAPAAGERSGPGGDLTDDQLRDFAARLGLPDDDAGDAEADDDAHDNGTYDTATHDTATHDSDAPAERRGEPGDRAEDGPRRVATVVVRWVVRPTGRVLIVTARYVGATARWLRSTGERIAER